MATKRQKKSSVRKLTVKKVTGKVAQKEVAKKSVKGKSVKVQRVPPRIIKRPSPSSVNVPGAEFRPIDTEKAVAFAMSIAQEMKRSAAKAEQARETDSIRLSRRPTSRSHGKITAKFPASDLKEFRKRLLEARAQAMSGANAMKETGFDESEDHEADGGDGTNQTLRLQALGQVENINRTIQQIDEALHRIDDGSYGICTLCGQLIRKPRLLNQPFVLTCMECQNEVERDDK